MAQSKNLLREVAANNIEGVKKALKLNANVNYVDQDGSFALKLAARDDKYYEVAKLLLDNGAIVNGVDKYDKQSALLVACENGCIRLVLLFLSKGASVNMCDDEGKTALMRSCKLWSSNCMKILLEHGARIDIEDNEGKTVLMMLDNEHAKKNKLQTLSEYATRVQDKEGRTALMKFCGKRPIWQHKKTSFG